MYKEKINDLIKEAMKAGDKTALKVYRLIKSEYQKFETSGNGIELDDAQEVKILNKLLKQWNEEKSFMESGGRDTSEISGDIKVIEDLLPKTPSKEELENEVIGYINEYFSQFPEGETKTMKHMGGIMALAKKKNPFIDGKVISEVYKNNFLNT